MVELYTSEQLKYLYDLSEDDIKRILKKSFGLEENETIKVKGELALFYTLNANEIVLLKKVILLKNGKQIEYPIKDISSIQYSIKKDGIFVGFQEELQRKIKDIQSLTVVCELELAPKYEREKHNNPFELNVILDSIRVIEKLGYKDAFIEIQNEHFAESSILNYIKQKYKQQLLEAYKKEEEEIRKRTLAIKSTLDKEQKSYQKLQNELSEEYKKQKLKIEQEISKIQLKLDKKQKSYNKIEENLNKIKQDIKIKKIEANELVIKINNLNQELNLKEEIMANKLQKLRNFIKDKADMLLKLEFIDEEDYNELLMIKTTDETDEKFIDFTIDLNQDKQKAISHIQAYLFNKNIIYPRYIIEEFFALVQTNDLIILAGESGSGKTNLVKSFAEAVGGKSFIIPVKPNWTGSEDLLGYYNPLEKKYLATPFLEALLEASNNPDIPYFICLDEMNLARVEYYFADFLSLLEERNEQPKIKLYSDDEAAHILSEFKHVIDTIKYLKEKYKKNDIVNFIQLLQDEKINKELTRIFGFSDKDSLIKYHTDLRRMLSGILNTPSSIKFPKNVRIIGAINIDETTHYLSPKILDRSHIMKFDSPLLQDWTKIADEIEEIENNDLKIKFDIDDLGIRKPYPSYDRNEEFCKTITLFTKEYFSPLGIEVGLRTIRQGLNYKRILLEQKSNEKLVLNNFILYKILPKMTFDTNKEIKDGRKKDELLLNFKEELKKYIDQDFIEEHGVNSIKELDSMIKISQNNDGIMNYWA